MSIPGSGSPLLLATTAAAADAGYVIPKSLRFNSGDSAYLHRNLSVAGNRKTWTFSAWFKRTKFGTQEFLFTGVASTGHGTQIEFDSNNRIHVYHYESSFSFQVRPSRQLRDPAAWYHIVVAFDTTQSTAADRVKIYINGALEDQFENSSYPGQNTEWQINKNVIHYINAKSWQSSINNYTNNYLADVQFVDGEAFQATDFGETRSSDGVWVPKEFTGFGKNPNDGTTWSSGTVTGTLFSGSSWTKAFDGELPSSLSVSNSAMSYNSTGDITLTLPKAISGTIRVYASSASGSTLGTDSKIVLSDNSEISCNIVSSAPQFFTFGEKTNITSITLKQATAGVRLAGVEVDGHLLVDGRRDNSFHLNFSDSSTNEALGFDSAPTIPALDPKKGMDVITYTGTYARLNVGGLNFEPGLVWIKNTDSGSSAHFLADSVRGGTKVLQSNATGAENTRSNHILSFNPDGFTLGADGTSNYPSGNSFVAWTWRAGGPAVSNSDGTITSQVSANTDYGFSIVSYTGNNTSGATVGHGLSSAPKWIIVKSRNQTGQFWHVYHEALASNEYIYLNSNSAKTSGADFMNSTDPTSSVFTLGNGNGCNKSSDPVIAYCWSEVSGYSKFGSYTGTSSTVTVTTGFKPRWVLVKNTTTGSLDWVIVDSARSNADAKLFPNTSAAESAQDAFDFNDNGFTIKVVDHPMNKDGDTFIYAAFADRPGNNWNVNNIVTNEGLTTSKSQFDVVTYTGNGGAQKIGGGAKASEGITATGTGAVSGISSDYPISGAFDGSTSTYLATNHANISSNPGILTVTFPAGNQPNYSSSVVLEVWASTTDTVKVAINGGAYQDVSSSSNDWQSHTVATGSGTITEIKVSRQKGNTNNGAAELRAITVDGVQLLDGYGPGLKFQPDLVWVKERNSTSSHQLTNVISGVGKRLATDMNNAEYSNSEMVKSLNSDGFTLGNHGGHNENNKTYVAWCWKAGGTAVSNTDGSITSSVSANAAYGFSIIKFTTASDTSGGATVGHGLSAQPSLYMYKPTSTTGEWVVVSSHDYDQFAYLNATTQFRSISSNGGGTPADPTNSVLSLYDLGVTLASKTYICYAFANVPGYQRIGSYVGNGSSTGPVIPTGFRPRFLMIKKTSGTGPWYMYDSERDNAGNIDKLLQAESSAVEFTTGANYVDFQDSGFQLKGTGGDTNASGGTYVYLAIGDDEIGSDEDCLVDVPNAVTADADATDTTGGYQRGNYATMNPLHSPTGSSFSNGNLKVSNSGGWYSHTGTIGVASGKWYYEFEKTSGSYTGVGWRNDITTAGNPSFNANGGGIYLSHNGNKQSSAGSVSYGATWGSGDIVGVAFDCDAGTIEFYKNGVSQGQAFTGMTDGTFFPEVQIYQSGGVINFGQMRFKYPMPTGFSSLNTTALPAATIADGSTAFNTRIWSGDANTSRALTGLNMAPDLVWIKKRSDSFSHFLFDSVRGSTKQLKSDSADAESTTSNKLISFDSDGFTVGNAGAVNGSGDTYVGWAWDAGSSTVSNTDGSITSQVRANTSAGISIVAYTGNGSSSATVGHGLNAQLGMLIHKRRDNTGSWKIKHISLPTNHQLLFSDAASVDVTGNHGGGMADLSSNSTFGFAQGLTNVDNVNGNNVSYINYCFAPVAGFSHFTSFEGTASSDPVFVYCGFRPAWILRKNADAGSRNWYLHDTARDPFNVCDAELYPHKNSSESEHDALDILSNGFAMRTSNANHNASGQTIIVAAFAENPFQANGGLAR